MSPAGQLVGRRDEQAAIDRLLDRARRGRGGALAVSGPVGIGKTALLDRATGAAARLGAPVLHVGGVPQEQDLPYAALGRLLRPVADRTGTLPAEQRSPLEAILAGREPPPPASDPAVGLATSAILAATAREAGLVVVLDDAQWTDRPSLEALSFAARRAGGEPLVVLLAARPGTAGFPPPGIEELALGGLAPDEAAALIERQAPQIAGDVRARLLTEAHGNPAALLELPATLTRDQLEGRVSLAGRPFGTRPAHTRVLTEFHHRIEGLPRGAQALVLVAAAEPTADPPTVLQAAGRLGASVDDLTVAEGEGLIRAHPDTVEPAHPLARAAAYRRAPLGSRLEAHQALAEALAPARPGRAAWHRSLAVAGHDDAVAAELGAVAEHALGRGRPAIASAAFERAAQLVTSPHLRARHLAAAAEAALLVSLDPRAAHLVDRAQQASEDPAVRDRITLVHAAMHDPPGDHRGRHRTYTETAETVAATTPAAAAELLAAAAEQAWYLGDARAARDTATRRRGLVVPGPARQPGRDQLADLIASLTAGDVAGALPLLPAGAGVGAPLRHGGPVVEDLSLVCTDLGGRGSPPAPGTELALAYRRAVQSLMAGRFPEAGRAADAALATLGDGHDLAPAACCLWHRSDRAHWLSRFQGLAAWLAAVEGDADRCRALADQSFTQAGSPVPTPATALATWALALLDLGLGRHEEAVARLTRLKDGAAGHLVVTLHALPDLIEASVRAGRGGDAVGLLVPLGSLAETSDLPWMGAVLARCRALTSPGDEAERHFAAALRMHGPTDQPYEQARTQLTYAEWLRRAARRREARDHMVVAWEVFTRLGARPWAARAASELRAAGYRVASPPPEGDRPGGDGPAPPADHRGAATVAQRAALAELSQRELEIIRLAAAGASNREIGAKLYLSPRTIGYHLYKAYPKLGITSRRELAPLLGDLISRDGPG